MFCPECGALGFPDASKWIKCSDYKCGYRVPISGLDGKGGEFTDPLTGEVFDLSSTVASNEAADLSRHEEPMFGGFDCSAFSKGVKGVACIRCDSTDTVAISSMRRAASRGHTQHYECNSCSCRWIER